MAHDKDTYLEDYRLNLEANPPTVLFSMAAHPSAKLPMTAAMLENHIGKGTRRGQDRSLSQIALDDLRSNLALRRSTHGTPAPVFA